MLVRCEVNICSRFSRRPILLFWLSAERVGSSTYDKLPKKYRLLIYKSFCLLKTWIGHWLASSCPVYGKMGLLEQQNINVSIFCQNFRWYRIPLTSKPWRNFQKVKAFTSVDHIQPSCSPVFKNLTICTGKQTFGYYSKCTMLSIFFVGSGCGSVGRAVASDTRGPRFESSHRQKKYIFIEHLLTVNCVLKRRK